MNTKRPTLKDVAARAKVSIATVSNVFSGNKPVNKELRARVEKAAQELSYQLDRAASQLKSGRARVVGILVPDLDDTFFTSLISRLEVMADKNGYDVIVASSRDQTDLEQSRLRTLLGWRPSGIIAVPCSDEIPALLRQEAGRLPTVLVDRVNPDVCFTDTVTIDNFDAGQLAADCLIKLGHEHIVLAASNAGIAPIKERIRGASSIIESALGREPIVVVLGSKAEPGADIFAQWLSDNPLPSAVFALTNVTTLAVLGALARHHIDVPDRVSLVGFDDYSWMTARRRPLTAIRQPVDEIAALAWERLCARMDGDTAAAQPSILKTTLQHRESTRSVLKRSEASIQGIL
ncbi:MAG: LacI family DNA-binding transcriptional regulator [Phyllobacterium sp.]